MAAQYLGSINVLHCHAENFGPCGAPHKTDVAMTATSIWPGNAPYLILCRGPCHRPQSLRDEGGVTHVLNSAQVGSAPQLLVMSCPALQRDPEIMQVQGTVYE